MIYDILENSVRYEQMHGGFAKAFTFLRRPDLLDLQPGRYPIDEERVYAMVAREQGRSRIGAQLERHEKYIDIQMVLSGTDEMGWRPCRRCAKPAGSYDPDNDIGFFSDVPMAWLPVAAGMFVIFFPEDAHLPLISSGLIHKVVVKVANSLT